MTLLPLLIATSLPTQAATQRFALVAGANDGGSDRVQLRYADDDARAVAALLSELGGVEPLDHHLLQNTSRSELMNGLSTLASEVANAEASGLRTEVVVYYSGHSDDKGLLLGDQRLPYEELRASLDAVPADVRILILDSCASGSMIRAKGGSHLPAFLVDESADVRGHAYLTSSSADEAAQEAERIGGSTFTHFLLTGLRGAADVSGDGRVTLDEAYRFAYGETLGLTEGSRIGPQHAAFEMSLAGSGDLVMTDLSQTGASLVLDEGVSGRIYVRDEANRLVAELYKPIGQRLLLGLAPGRYSVLVDDGEDASEAVMELSKGDEKTLSELEFSQVRGLAGVTKGPRRQLKHEPVHLGMFPSEWLGSDSEPTRQNVAIDFVGGHTTELHGVGAALGVNVVNERATGLQMAIGGVLAGEQMRGAQLSVGASVVGGEMVGFQAATGTSIARTVHGLQSSVGPSIAQDVHGAQVALIAAAGSVDGAQVALVSVADKPEGAQVGLVNVAGDAKGLQLGLVNVAETLDGVPIGLVNIIGNGIHDVELSASDLALANLGLKLGGTHVYTSWEAGYRQDAGGQSVLITGLALGGRFHPGRFELDTDVGSYTAQTFDFTGNDALLVRARMSIGYRLGPVAIFGGPTLNLAVIQGTMGNASSPLLYEAGKLPGTNLPMWAGFTAGLRL